MNGLAAGYICAGPVPVLASIASKHHLYRQNVEIFGDTRL
jgi:hypothetical protein